jgi:uncharacterized membrane protein YgcG
MQTPRRKPVYAAAWVLFGLSLLVSRGSVIADGVNVSRQMQRGLPAVGFISVVVFILACFSNLIFGATPLIRNSARVTLGWRILLIASVINNAAIGACFHGGYLKQPAYWLWLIAFVGVTWSLLWLPPDAVVSTSTARSSKKRPAIADDGVPGLIWIWLAFTFFWIGVMTVSYLHPQKPAALSVAAAPKPLKRLTRYLEDPGNVMPASDAARIDAELARFEKETSNQIAVVVFPEAPEDDIENFTIHAAEAWKVGRQGRDNGAILFLFLKQRIARLEVGYGLEGALPDAVARQILDQQLGGNVARGNVAEGIDRAVASMAERVRSEFTAGRTPGIIRTTLARLRSVFTMTAPQAWPFIRDTTVDQRAGISFFGSLLGLGIASGVANAGRICLNLVRAGTNIARRRPLGYGMVPVELDSVVDTVKLIALVAVPLAGVVVLIAGGGAFGGAGATIHWSALVP